MAARTRREALKDLSENYVTTHSNEGPARIASNKFAIFSQKNNLFEHVQVVFSAAPSNEKNARFRDLYSGRTFAERCRGWSKFSIIPLIKQSTVFSACPAIV